MADDVLPELLEKIFGEYKRLIKESTFITRFSDELSKGIAKDSDVSLYGEELGNCASIAFLKFIKEENLPDGILYWNIAERTIEPLLRDVYQKVNDAAEQVQLVSDKKIKVNIKPQHAEFPKDRVHDLIDKAIDFYNGKEVDDGLR